MYLLIKWPYSKQSTHPLQTIIFSIYCKLSLSLVYIACFKVPCSSLGVFESLKEGECSQTWIALNSIVAALSNSLNVLYNGVLQQCFAVTLIGNFWRKTAWFPTCATQNARACISLPSVSLHWWRQYSCELSSWDGRWWARWAKCNIRISW